MRDFRLPFSWRTATFRPESSLQPRACRHGGGGFVARCGCIRAHRGVTARHATQRAIRVRGGPRRREALRGDRAFRRVAQRQTCEPHPRVPRPHVENTRGGDGVSERGPERRQARRVFHARRGRRVVPSVRLALGLEGGDAMDSRIIGLETTRVRLRGDTRHEPTTRPHDLRRRRIHALPREHARPSRDRETSDV